MKILITNIWLHNHAGTECYVRDLSIALKAMGHEIEIFTSEIGDIANEIKAHGINVVDKLDDLKNIPDVIHAQHNLSLDAMNKFLGVSAVYFCHSGISPYEKPVSHPNIVKYIAVDLFCQERLISEGIEDSEVIYNWVNTDRFKQKEKINGIPTRALLFSNALTKKDTVRIQEACKSKNIELHFMGLASGNYNSSPEDVLKYYDIVFAKAKCAMEAMACGCAVILNDFSGFGEMITPDNFDYARQYNFGFKLLNPRNSNRKDVIRNELMKYNPLKIKMVSDRIRSEASFDNAFKKILNVYTEISK